MRLSYINKWDLEGTIIYVYIYKPRKVFRGDQDLLEFRLSRCISLYLWIKRFPHSSISEEAFRNPRAVLVFHLKSL